MKWQVALILLSIALSIIVPPVLPPMTDHDRSSVIGTLDVCHSAIPALLSNGDIPCVHEYPCRLMPLKLCTFTAIVCHLFKPHIVFFQDERPPKA